MEFKKGKDSLTHLAGYISGIANIVRAYADSDSDFCKKQIKEMMDDLTEISDVMVNMNVQLMLQEGIDSKNLLSDLHMIKK